MSEAVKVDDKPADTHELVVEPDAASSAGDYFTVSWIALIAAMLVTSAGIGAYHFLLGKPSVGFAVVDIASVVKVKEAEFTAMLSHPNVSDADRQAAYQLVSRIGPEIERAVGELQKECACTIIVKSAVIAGAAEDLTPRLKEMLGMTTRTEERS